MCRKAPWEVRNKVCYVMLLLMDLSNEFINGNMMSFFISVMYRSETMPSKLFCFVFLDE